MKKIYLHHTYIGKEIMQFIFNQIIFLIHRKLFKN